MSLAFGTYAATASVLELLAGPVGVLGFTDHNSRHPGNPELVEYRRALLLNLLATMRYRLVEKEG